MRIKSIDIFRAITMLLMIFVNDLWTLKGIPSWLDHAEANVDFLGLADVVFPCFLFVLGMAIPYAIKNRIEKGQSKFTIAKHIVLRSLALIVMGLFTVNQSSLNANATGMSFPTFTLLMLAAFFLIWNVYPKSETRLKFVFTSLQIFGVAILLYLAFIFRGNTWNSKEVAYFGIQWWGILGLIGWTYLVCALIYLFSVRKPLWIAIIALLFFHVNNILGKALDFEWFVGNGAFHALSMAGVVATLLFEKYRSKDKPWHLYTLFLIAGVIFIAAGFLSRQFFIISKIHATPTWVLLCTGISFILFIAIYCIVDVYKKDNYFSIIAPAGSSTLTCYLVPYLCYSVFEIIHLQLPEIVIFGSFGLIKSIAFAFMVIGITAVLGKMKVKLKI